MRKRDVIRSLAGVGQLMAIGTMLLKGYRCIEATFFGYRAVRTNQIGTLQRLVTVIALQLDKVLTIEFDGTIAIAFGARQEVGLKTTEVPFGYLAQPHMFRMIELYSARVASQRTKDLPVRGG